MSEEYIMYISAAKDEGYPYHTLLSEPITFSFYSPYPAKMLRISNSNNEGYPYHPFLPEPVSFQFASPYPARLFIISEDITERYPFLSLSAPVPFKFEHPYPAKMYRVSEGNNHQYPYLPMIESLGGAFKGAINLHRVDIPKSCKSIDELSFANTSLKTIKIPIDCKYSHNSFPEDCKVVFYNTPN